MAPRGLTVETRYLNQENMKSAFVFGEDEKRDLTRISVNKMFEPALIESGFCILKQCEHFFPVQGYTGLWLLSESHFALHSFPEANQIYAELTSCVKEPFEKMKLFLKAQEKEL